MHSFMVAVVESVIILFFCRFIEAVCSSICRFLLLDSLLLDVRFFVFCFSCFWNDGEILLDFLHLFPVGFVFLCRFC